MTTKEKIQTQTLRPGFLVALHTTIRGNVHYEKKVLDPDHAREDGSKYARWETERVIADPKEHEEARQARGRACSILRSVCVQSAFGLLCPESRAEELYEAIQNAKAEASSFNAKAKLGRVEVSVLTGRIAADDVEAVRAIGGEVRDLLRSMEAGVKNMDVEAIRAAAVRAKGLGTMLSQQASDRVQEAVAAARELAKKIVKAGDNAALEVDAQVMKKIKAARVSFLDLGEERVIARPKTKARSVDLGQAPKPTKPARKKAPAIQLEGV
jgi:hypothetical protein